MNAGLRLEKAEIRILTYVNTRIENIKKSGGTLNAGAISAEGNRLLTGFDSIAAHGKILLKGVRDELKTRNITDLLLTVSETVVIPELRDLWAEAQPAAVENTAAAEQNLGGPAEIAVG